MTAKRERKRYEEEHKFDDFTAQVHYDSSFRKDLVNHYWDSFLIKECTDSQYLDYDEAFDMLPDEFDEDGDTDYWKETYNNEDMASNLYSVISYVKELFKSSLPSKKQSSEPFLWFPAYHIEKK